MIILALSIHSIRLFSRENYPSNLFTKRKKIHYKFLSYFASFYKIKHLTSVLCGRKEEGKADLEMIIFDLFGCKDTFKEAFFRGKGSQKM